MDHQNDQAKMNQYAPDLALLLATYPHVTAAWLDHPQHPTRITICTSDTTNPANIHLPQRIKQLKIRVVQNQVFKTLEATARPIDHRNEHQRCQDEPINLGTQIQPAGANWVGTAGAPVRWIDTLGDEHWGILSNWHVMVPESENHPTLQHQPTDTFPAIATLRDATRVDPDARNLVDAAIADAFINGRHTISPRILAVGQITRPPLNAYPGLLVRKAGRTTMLTRAMCSAVGAAVRVGYRDFTATFQDQDVYTSTDEPFSAAGDSGSLIFTDGEVAPVSLLFAGGGNLTIANPIRHVAKRFNLQYPFN